MDRFVTRASFLAGASARLLGWTPDLFWSATPSDLMLALGAEEEPGTFMDRDGLAELRAKLADRGN